MTCISEAPRPFKNSTLDTVLMLLSWRGIGEKAEVDPARPKSAMVKVDVHMLDATWLIF